MTEPNRHETDTEGNSSVHTHGSIKGECSDDSLSFSESKMRTKGGGKRLGIVCFEDEDSIQLECPSKTGSTGPESDQLGASNLNTMLEKVESFCIKFNLKPEVTSDFPENGSAGRLPDTRGIPAEDGAQSRSSKSSDKGHTGSDLPEGTYCNGRVLTGNGVEVHRKHSHSSQLSKKGSEVSEMTQTAPENELNVRQNRSRSIRFHTEKPDESESIQVISDNEPEARRDKSYSNQSRVEGRGKIDPASVAFKDNPGAPRRLEFEELDKNDSVQVISSDEQETHRKTSRSDRSYTRKPIERDSVHAMSNNTPEAHGQMSHSNRPHARELSDDSVEIISQNALEAHRKKSFPNRPHARELDESDSAHVIFEHTHEVPTEMSRSRRSLERESDESDSVQVIPENELEVYRKKSRSNRPHPREPSERNLVRVGPENELVVYREKSRSNRPHAREPSERNSVQVVPENGLEVYREKSRSNRPHAREPSENDSVQVIPENELEVYREKSRSNRSHAREPSENDSVQVIPENELEVYREKSRSNRYHTRARDGSNLVRMIPENDSEPYRNLSHARRSHVREPNRSDSLRVISENELGVYRKLSRPNHSHARDPDESDSVQEIFPHEIETHRGKSYSTRFRSRNLDKHYSETFDIGIEPEMEQEWKRASRSHAKKPDKDGTLEISPGKESEFHRRSDKSPYKESDGYWRYSDSKKRPEVDRKRMQPRVPSDEKQNEIELMTINSDFSPEKGAESRRLIQHGRPPNRRGMELTARIAVERDEEYTPSDESVSSKQSISGENATRKGQLPVVGFEDELDKFEKNVDEMRHLIRSCYESVGTRPSMTFKRNVSGPQKQPGITQSRRSRGFSQDRHARAMSNVHFSRSDKSLETSSFERLGAPSRDANSTGFGQNVSRAQSRGASRQQNISKRPSGHVKGSTISLDSNASHRRIMDGSRNSRGTSQKQSFRKRRSTDIEGSVESLDSNAPETRSHNDASRRHSKSATQKRSLSKKHSPDTEGSVESLESNAAATREGSQSNAFRRHLRGTTRKRSLSNTHGNIEDSVESLEFEKRSPEGGQIDAPRIHSRGITRRHTSSKRHDAYVEGSIASLESETRSKEVSQNASRVHSRATTRKRSLSKRHGVYVEGSDESLRSNAPETHDASRAHPRSTTRRRSLNKKDSADIEGTVQSLESNSSQTPSPSGSQSPHSKRPSIHFGSSVRHQDLDTSSVNSCDAFQIPDPSGRNRKLNSRLCKMHFGGIIEEYDSAGRKISNAEKKGERRKEASKRVWSNHADDSMKSNGQEMSSVDVFDESADKDGEIEDDASDVQKAISQSLSELAMEIDEEPSESGIAGPSQADPSVYSGRQRGFEGARGRRDALTPDDPAARALAALAPAPACMDPERHHVFQRRINDLKRDIKELQGELCDEQDNWREKLQMMQETVSNYEKLGEIFREFL